LCAAALIKIKWPGSSILIIHPRIIINESDAIAAAATLDCANNHYVLHAGGVGVLHSCTVIFVAGCLFFTACRIIFIAVALNALRTFF